MKKIIFIKKNELTADTEISTVRYLEQQKIFQNRVPNVIASRLTAGTQQIPVKPLRHSLST